MANSDRRHRQANKHSWSAHNNAQAPPLPRPSWTGSLVFGRVTLPVNLYPAVKGKQTSLTMVDKTGAGLKRRQLCSAEHTMLMPDDIVRGYEAENGQFILVEDFELAALQPEKSSSITLQEFVDFNQVDPIYFDKSYFLVPHSSGMKAYRLLAESMAQENRAGIATFVMRDHEHLVAVISHRGILRAEILRFYDDVRNPEDVGLSSKGAETVPANNLTATPEHLYALIDSMSVRKLDYNKLQNPQTARLKQTVKEKLASNEGVVRKTSSWNTVEEDAAITAMEQDIGETEDLMQFIKVHIHSEDMSTDKPEQPPHSESPKRSGNNLGNAEKSEQQAIENNDRLKRMTRGELYEEARALDISGRSKMSKQQLQNALVRQSSLH